MVAGNCEEQLAAGGTDCGCGFEEGSTCDLLAKGWYPYANARLSAESRDWMKQLPAAFAFTFGGLRFQAVHGGISQSNKFVFGSQVDALATEFETSDADVVIAGHCGLPFIAKSGPRAWFNPGVIGMPANDGTPDVWFGLIAATGTGVQLETRRLSYDYAEAAAALRRSGHANSYARTLLTGVWPSLDILPGAERAATGRRLKSQKLKLTMPEPALRNAS